MNEIETGDDNNENGTRERPSTSATETTVVVCCGCRRLPKAKGRKYQKEAPQKGFLRVLNKGQQGGTGGGAWASFRKVRRYKDSSLGLDSEWTAFSAEPPGASTIQSPIRGGRTSLKPHQGHTTHEDLQDTTEESLFFFDAVDRPLGDNEYPIDGYAISSGVVFTTSMAHPAPSVNLRQDPSTMLRPSAIQHQHHQRQTKTKKKIVDHQRPSVRFHKVRNRSHGDLTAELQSPRTKIREKVQDSSRNNTELLEDAIGLAGYPGKLTIEELEECQKFLRGLHDLSPAIAEQVYSYRDVEEEPYTICRWLRATKFQADDILARLVENQPLFEAAQRDDFYGPNIEPWLGCPLSVFLSQYPFLPIGVGKNGSPVNYFLAGHIQPEGILCLVSIAQLQYYFWYSFMHKMKDEIRTSQQADPDFCRCEGINVVDLSGLSSSALTSETMEVIKISSKISDLFPETLHCMLIINAPSFFAFSWRIIKKFIDPRTASRIQLFSSKEKGLLAMEKLIDKTKNIPSDYGGGNISLRDGFLNEVSDPLIVKQEIELLSIKKKKGTAPLTTTWTLGNNETMDVSIYTRSISAAEISVIYNGVPIQTGQAQCRFDSSHGGPNDSGGGSDNDDNATTPCPNRIVLTDSTKDIVMVGPGQVMITATDLDSPISKEKQYSSLSRGYFLVVGDVKNIDTIQTVTPTKKPTSTQNTTSTTTPSGLSAIGKRVSFSNTAAAATKNKVGGKSDPIREEEC